MRERRFGPPPAVGGSSLLVIFAVLCLTVFALLSLSTAQAGTRLSRRSADAVAEYYRMDTAAEETLAEIRGGKLPRGVSRSGDVYSYAVRGKDGTQELAVRVRVDGTSWAVLRWQLVSTQEWKADDSQSVWDGG